MMASRYSVRALREPEQVRALLRHDAALNAYLLGDLDPAFWPLSRFIGAFADEALRAVVLFYHGLEPVILTASGETDGVRAVLDAVTLPREVYTLVPEALGAAITERYDLQQPHMEWRMVLDLAAFVPPANNQAVRLGPEDAGALAALYAQAAGPGEAIVAFSPAQIAQGIFFGVRRGGELVAAAGTHIHAPGEGVAAVGNVFTHRDWRRHGLATQCTAAVSSEAARSVHTIVLNVRADNVPAMRVYERLGYRRYALFVEGPGVCRCARQA